ncbi:MAG: hypothetical protein ABIJ16_04510 [Bacteroidota bacterium]
MRKYGILFFTFFIGLSLLFTFCKKEDDPDDSTIEIVFDSLIAANDTIHPGESTSVTATATGDEITYQWTASGGDITGSGAQVTFVAPPCTIGDYDLTCKVVDKADKSKEKTITITVVF